MKTLRLSMFLVGLSLLCPKPSGAALVIAIGNADGQATPVQVTPGQMGASIRVEARAIGESFGFSGYNLALEFGGNGFGIPESGGTPLFSNFSAVPVLGGFNLDTVVNLDRDLPADNNALAVGAGAGPINYDFIADDSRAAVPLPLLDGQSSALFDLTFDVAPGASSGIFDVQFVLNPSFPADLGFDNNFSTNPEGRPLGALNGSVQITAVPEPSSVMMAVVGLVGGSAIFLRRRKTRSTGNALALP